MTVSVSPFTETMLVLSQDIRFIHVPSDLTLLWYWPFSVNRSRNNCQGNTITRRFTKHFYSVSFLITVTLRHSHV